MDNDFDPLGRLLKKTNTAPQGGQEISSYAYTYDNHDRRTSVTRKDALRIEYGYDAIGQLTSAVRKFPGPGNVTDYSYNYHYQYDPAGNPVARTENGRTTGYTYNKLNQHDGATAPSETDVSGVLARPASQAVAVSVNGLPAEVNTIAPEAFAALALSLNTNQQGVAWHRLGLPLTEGENTFTVRASTAAGLRVVNGQSKCAFGKVS